MLEVEGSNPQQKNDDRGVLCAKCEHLNRHGQNECRRCGAHLYVACVDCGKRNERVRTRCTSCGRRLHRSVLERYRRRIFGKISVSLVHVVLFFAAIGLLFGIIVFVATVRLPSLW